MLEEWIMPMLQKYNEEFKEKPIIENESEVKADDIVIEPITDEEVLGKISIMQEIFNKTPVPTETHKIKLKVLDIW